MVKCLNRVLINGRGIGGKATAVALDEPDVDSSVAIWKRQLESTSPHDISERMSKSIHNLTGANY